MSRQPQTFLATCMLFATTIIPAQAQYWGQPQQGANGQQRQTQQGQGQPAKRPNTYKVDKHQFDTVSFYTVPDMPYFPQWTGQKPLLVEGLTFPKMAPRQLYTMIWQFREDAPTVTSWYTDALRGTGWKVLPDSSNATVIDARHTQEPIDVSIQITPGAKTGYRCTAQIRYDKHLNYKKKR